MSDYVGLPLKEPNLFGGKRKKEEVELEIFRDFAKVCPLEIDPGSIHSSENPPDIICTSEILGQIYFELVELTDQSIQKHYPEKEFLRERLESSAKCKAGYMEKYENACIDVELEKKLNNTKLTEFINELVDLLMSDDLPGEFQGDILCHLRCSDQSKTFLQKWKKGLKAVVNRDPDCHYETPCFSTNRYKKSIDLQKVFSEGIRKKFNKPYHLDERLELLAYIGACPPLPARYWKAEVQILMDKEFFSSPFSRIWIFDSVNKKIEYKYP